MKKCRIKGNSAFISSCHPRGFLSGISSLLKRQSGGDSQLQHLGMTPNLMGFTLIELLVVVLIIGILAAVAVPQYQRAVLKSRFGSLMPMAKALSNSEEVYYLDHDTYTDDESQLDITDIDAEIDITLGNEAQHKYVLVTRDDIKNNLVMYQKHSPNFAGETHCEAEQGNALANWLCKDSLNGKFLGNKYGYAVYTLDENTAGTLARVYYNGSGPFTDGDVCVGDKNWTGCTGKRFSGESVCVVKGGARACNGSIFDHSYCIGVGNWQNSACGGYGNSFTTYNNHSVCYAVAKTTCTGGTKYDETSCCEGKWCPDEKDTCAYKGITPPPPPAYTQY